MADRVSRGRLDRDRALQLVARHGARALRAADPARQSRGPPRRPGASHPRGRESRRAGAARPAARAAPPVGLRDHPVAARARRPALMAKLAVRLRAVEIVVGGALVCIAGRAAQLQLLEGRRWAEEARAQRTEHIVLPARRGALTDRHGTPLALTQETYHVGVAANELRDPAKDAPRVARQLRLPTPEVQRALRRRYAYFAGPYSTLDVQPLRPVRGVHLEPVLNRFYPAPDLARPVIGRVGDDGRGASGLERALDSLLAGRAGAAVVLKDRAGREYESPARVISQPVAGADVALTLDAELQEIAQRALDDAIRRMDAGGGGVVMMDPATGAVLAVAPREHSAMLGALGSGAPGGLGSPAEATGRLRPPAEWSGLSAGSLAMGYEVSVTPLQLAVAYAALANDGVLLAPTLIRDVRGPGGDVVYRHRPEPVRRVVRPEVAAALRALLRGVALARPRLPPAAPRAAAQPLDDAPGVVPSVGPGPSRPDSVPAMADVARRRAVPDVTGRPLREAVRALHRRGFRVALKGWGVAHHTWHAAGDSAAAGATVTLFAAPRP